MDLGKKLLTVSFLVIVVCAPVGAAAIQFSGPWLLRKGSAENGDNLNGPVTQNTETDSLNGDEQHKAIVATKRRDNFVTVNETTV